MSVAKRREGYIRQISMLSFLKLRIVVLEKPNSISAGDSPVQQALSSGNQVTNKKQGYCSLLPLFLSQS